MEHFYLQRTMPGQALDLREFTRVMDLAADEAAPPAPLTCLGGKKGR